MSDFVAKVRELGPLAQSEGIEAGVLTLKLDALSQLVPYMKLVERERLRVPTKTEEAYKAFYESDEVDRVFHDLIADKLTISQILMLLEEKPLSTREISERLGLNPSDISKHMTSSSRQGLVRYDLEQKCYALA
jgi:hypothetical protein